MINHEARASYTAAISMVIAEIDRRLRDLGVEVPEGT